MENEEWRIQNDGLSLISSFSISDFCKRKDPRFRNRGLRVCCEDATGYVAAGAGVSTMARFGTLMPVIFTCVCFWR